jgi:hypothetical protein
VGDGGREAPEVSDHRVILARSGQGQSEEEHCVEVTRDVQSWLRKQLEEASPDLLRVMVQEFAQALMGAEADALCDRRLRRVSPSGGKKTRTGVSEAEVGGPVHVED